jgi:ketosteroid isomerase-like protein
MKVNSDLDPDVAWVLANMAATPERRRQKAVRAKHKRQTADRLETQIELLSDEVERVIPKTDPNFVNVVIAAVLRKITRQQEEPEYKSGLEFPEGW